jgi:hypothetical protein
MNITINGGGETRGNDYFVTVDHRSADHLTCDEVLGVVASALFSDKPIFVRTEEEREAWLKAIGTHDDNSIIAEDIAE